MIKFVGAFILIIATTMYGFNLGFGYVKRIDNLKELKKVLVILDGELRYNSTPIKIAFRKIANRGENIFSELLNHAYDEMDNNPGVSLKSAWNNAVNTVITEKYCFKNTDVDKLIEFGTNLENMDKDSRNSVFEGYINEISIDIENASDEKDNKVKLYRTLGIMSGIFITILIV